MNKKEFHKNFRDMIDAGVDALPLPARLSRLAKQVSRTPETLQKWYDGVSAPANASREAVIRYLYAEQKKREVMDIVRHVIRNDLKIEVVQDQYTPMYEGDPVSAEIRLKLGDEVIYTTWITLR